MQFKKIIFSGLFAAMTLCSTSMTNAMESKIEKTDNQIEKEMAEGLAGFLNALPKEEETRKNLQKNIELLEQNILLSKAATKLCNKALKVMDLMCPGEKEKK